MQVDSKQKEVEALEAQLQAAEEDSRVAQVAQAQVRGRLKGEAAHSHLHLH